jgi:putative addiction module component (TIGR02574 family)
MDTTLIRSQLEHLPPAERLALIGTLWDSLDDQDRPVTPAQAAELLRRLDHFDADRNDAMAWADLKADLLARRS